MFQSPGQIAFSLGPVSLHWYGLMIGLGILACAIYASRELKRFGKSADSLYDMGFWIILCGVIGARLYYVIFQWELYASNPLEIFQIWRGGLAIHGALIGGFIAFYGYCAIKKINWLFFADLLAPGIVLAQAFGRWGNFFNNEAFGRPADLPWKLFIPQAFRPENYENFEYFHPAFLYESLWNLIGFFVLAFLFRKIYPNGRISEKHSGLIFASYLAFYSFGRFFIESLRTDSLMLGPLRVAQLASVILFMAGIFGIKSLRPFSK